MNDSPRNDPYARRVDIGVTDQTRATFLMRTYGHLLGAMIAFTLIEIALFRTGMAAKIWEVMMGAPWLIWLGAFMLIGFLARRFAASSSSRALQYVGLSLYVVALALIFVPLLYLAVHYANDPAIIPNAAFATLIGFSVLTAIVFITKSDFSWMRSLLMWGGICAMGFIVAAAIFGLSGGIIFPILMVALAGGYILYDTSNVMHHYPADRYVGASLALFSSVALMFYYVLIIFLRRD